MKPQIYPVRYLLSIMGAKEKEDKIKVAFIGCWCHLRIYAIQASHVKESLEKLIGEEIKVITSNCGCYYHSLPSIFTSLYNYRALLTDRDVTFIKLPHLRLKNDPTIGYLIRSAYRGVSEPLRGIPLC